MKTYLLNKPAILEKYPEQKPLCLNYAVIRSELIALAEENERLYSRLCELLVQLAK